MKYQIIGPLKLSGNNLLDAYGNVYCTKAETQYYKECNYRGYKYYATMTDVQEKAVAQLLIYLCKQHNIPKVFKPNADQIFSSNKEAQDFDFGEEFTDDIIHKILDSVDDDFHDGISILGGEPLDPKNAPDVLRLVKSFRDKYGYDKSIWVYTGYIFENLVDISNPSVIDILNSIDILVDGPFIESQKSLLLKFRGSRNQRIILSKRSIESKEVITMDDKDIILHLK